MLKYKNKSFFSLEECESLHMELCQWMTHYNYKLNSLYPLFLAFLKSHITLDQEQEDLILGPLGYIFFPPMADDLIILPGFYDFCLTYPVFSHWYINGAISLALFRDDSHISLHKKQEIPLFKGFYRLICPRDIEFLFSTLLEAYIFYLFDFPGYSHRKPKPPYFYLYKSPLVSFRSKILTLFNGLPYPSRSLYYPLVHGGLYMADLDQRIKEKLEKVYPWKTGFLFFYSLLKLSPFLGLLYLSLNEGSKEATIILGMYFTLRMGLWIGKEIIMVYQAVNYLQDDPLEIFTYAMKFPLTLLINLLFLAMVAYALSMFFPSLMFLSLFFLLCLRFTWKYLWSCWLRPSFRSWFPGWFQIYILPPLSVTYEDFVEYDLNEGVIVPKNPKHKVRIIPKR